MNVWCKDQHLDTRHSGQETQLHRALFYDGEEQYLDGIMRFISPALDADEPVAAAVSPDHARLLLERLSGSADKVKMLDIFELGRNPSRIIPEIERLLAAGREGPRLHFVGEPIWPGRSEEEIQEAIKHEALVNLAWPGTPINLLCPYDVVGLSPEVLAHAEQTHPFVIRDNKAIRSDAYRGPTIPPDCDEPLPEPPPGASAMAVTTEDLSSVRALVSELAGRAGLSQERIGDLLLVASELSTNVIRHGHGTGTIHLWSQSGEVVCQVQDRGHIADPLAGRRMPVPLAIGGLGLWMVNQLCDLVQVRSGEHGTTVRAHVSLS